MATGQNPSILIGRGPANPPPVPKYTDKWVRRVYSAAKANVAGSPAEFKPADFSIPTPFYVDKVQTWNLDITHKFGLSATLAQGAITDLLADDVTGEDFGTSSALSSVTFKVPLGHATRVSNSSTTTIVSCGSVATLTSTQSVSQWAAHIHVWVAI